MELFLVSQSEALLLGRCVELYRQARTDYSTGLSTSRFICASITPGTPCFMECFESEVQRFYPPADEGTRSARRPAAPDNTTWRETKSGLAVGWCADDPRSLFFADGDSVIAVEKTDVPRCFRDLVGEWLQELVSDNDPLAGVAPDLWALRTFEIITRGDDPFKTRQRDKEDPKAITRRCVDLVSGRENDHLAVFDCGRLLGVLEADLRWLCAAFMNTVKEFLTPEQFELATDVAYGLAHNSEYWNPGHGREQIAINEWRGRILDHLQQLVRNDSISLVWICQNLLANCTAEFQQQTQEPEGDQSELPSRLRALIPGRAVVAAQDLLTRLHFALGSIIGHSRERDTRQMARDSASIVPRITILRPTASADEIRMLLDEVQPLFSAEGSSAIRPKRIVIDLSPAIEALARRNWPAEFASRRPDLTDILHKHRRSGTEAEEKFVALALPVYQNYRIAIQHHLETARVSWIEAFTFYSIIRLLVELSDRIQSEAKGGA